MHGMCALLYVLPCKRLRTAACRRSVKELLASSQVTQHIMKPWSLAQKLTVHWLQIALIRLYQSFTLRLVDGQVPLKTKTTITMAPANGVNMLVHPRP